MENMLLPRLLVHSDYIYPFNTACMTYSCLTTAALLTFESLASWLLHVCELSLEFSTAQETLTSSNTEYKEVV